MVFLRFDTSVVFLQAIARFFRQGQWRDGRFGNSHRQTTSRPTITTLLHLAFLLSFFVVLILVL
jgi:hypothetical protein